MESNLVAGDPARPPKFTVEERRKLAKEACRKVPCARTTDKQKYPCTFCPHEKKWLALHKVIDKPT